MPSLGNRIRQERKANKLTQAQLGDLIGVGKSSVCQWESGQNKTMIGTNVMKTAQALGVNPEWLLTGLEPKYPPVKTDPIHDRIIKILTIAKSEMVASGELFTADEVRRIYRFCVDYCLDPSITDKQFDEYVKKLILLRIC